MILLLIVQYVALTLIREKVREFKSERMLTKDNFQVTIDAILIQNN